jgi:hypothetical protein
MVFTTTVTYVEFEKVAVELGPSELAASLGLGRE